MESLETICRLCLKNCQDNFEVIDELMKEAFNTLLLVNNPAISEKPVVCTNCAEVVQKCFNFKSACFQTRDYIVPFINKNNKKLNLKDIYRNKEENKNIEIPDDYTVCAFCMRLSRSSFISLNNDEDVKMLKKCLPELDFRIVRNPVICTTCHGSLQNYFCFIMDCSIVEEKIKKYCQDACIKGLLKLSSMLKFISINRLTVEGEHNTVDKIKVEEFCGKTENDNVNHENENFAETDNQKCNNVLPLISKSTLACGEDDSKINIIKIEEEICKEEEIEVHHENQNFAEMEDQKFLTSVDVESEIKTEQHDFVRYQGGVLPQSEVAIKIRGRPKCCKLYQCEFCSYQTRYKRRFEIHALAHKTPSEVTMYQCEYCLFQTKYKNNLKKHLKGIHGNPTKEKIYHCKSCLYKTCRKQFFKDHLLIHKKTSEIKIYKCESCSYQTKRNYSLKRHLMIHKKPSKITMYQCESCSYQTKHNDRFKRHLMVHKIPSEITMYKCEYCSFQSKYKNNLNKHLKGIHGNLQKVNVYMCETCSYQTELRSNLVNHLQQIHRNPTEEKIYYCKSCSYETSRKQFFKVHLLMHKKPSEITIYQCEFCSFQTKHNCNLKRHLAIHKKSSEVAVSQCEYCPFQSKYKASIKRHLEWKHRIHREMNMHQPQSCEYQAKLKNTNEVHESIHKKPSEITSFSCEPYKFETKCEDQRHMPTNQEPSKLQCLIKTNFKKIFETV